jgi:simple sugar transport system permease protein
LRYVAVILSGALSGLAGAYLALNGPHGLFSDNMTGGRGFIALAAMIVGKWTPFGAMGACLLFGFGEALAIPLAGTTIGSFELSTYLVAMLPYLITIIAVAGLIGRSTPPAADGLPYDPAESS